MIYLATFVMTTMLFFLAGKCRGALELILAAIGLSLPCILAGIRGLDIGTDVMVYGIWTFRSALGSDLLAFLEAYSGVSPVGFNLFSWIVANLFCSFGVYLGALQLITIVPIYAASRYLFRKREWVCILCYLLLLYPLSLNTMKQSIAVAIGFAAVIFAFKNELLKYLIIIMVACSFHETGFAAALVYPLLRVIAEPQLGHRLFGKWRTLVVFAVWAACVAALIVFGREIILFFSQFKDSYGYQVSHIGEGGSNESILVLAVASAAAWRLCRRTVDSSSSLLAAGRAGCEVPATAGYDFYFTAFLLACVLMQLGIVAESVGRVGYYLVPYAGLFVSSLVYDTEKKGLYAGVAMVALFVVYFVFAFIVRGGGEIYPFATVYGEMFL